jgi:hypothetical protein
MEPLPSCEPSHYDASDRPSWEEAEDSMSLPD